MLAANCAPWCLLLAGATLAACAAAPRAPTSSPAATTAPATSGVSSAAAQAPPTDSRVTAEQALTRLFTADSPSSAWFTPAFLTAVSLAKVAGIVKDVHASGGAYVGARAVEGHWIVELERGSWRADVTLDDEGRFKGLWIVPDEVKTAKLEEALADFRALPGKVNVLVLSDGSERGSIEADLILAVGSTFKLAVLAALRADIEKKKRSWRDVVELSLEDKSLPSGILQDWPDRAPMTLYALAALMISRSDNTATDALIKLLGRETVEPYAPGNKPFITTREMFTLKAPGNSDALTRFRRGDEGARRSLLSELRNKPLPKVETYPKVPTALDVEWWFSARELCDLMKRVHDLSLMGINAGVAKRDAWSSIAYKGGSEPGVLNMTTWVEKDGHAHCVAATWNAVQTLDERAFTRAYSRIFTWLHGQP